ncbi:MAG: HAMP domain-containing sensor histidine kinase [Myxococcales bacterium]
MKLRPRLALTLLAVTVPLLAAVIYADTLSRQDAAERALTRFVRQILSEPDVRARCEQSSDGVLRPPAGFPPMRRPPPAGPPGGPSGGPPLGAPPDMPGGFPPDAPRGGPPFGPPSGPGGPLPPGPGGPLPPGPGGPLPAPGEFAHRKPAVIARLDAAFTDAEHRVLTLSSSQASTLESEGALGLSRPSERDVARIVLATPWGEGSCAYVLVTGSTEVWLGGFLPPTLVWLLPIALVLLSVWVAVGPPVRRLTRLAQAVRAANASDSALGIELAGDDEIAALARAFDAKSRELSSELRERTRREGALRDFLANTSHDVMVPLTVLLGHLSGLRGAQELSEESREALRGALNEAHYVTSLIQNLSLTASLDSAEPRVERAALDLRAVVERVVARHAPIARQLQVALDYAVPEEPLEVRGDVTMIEQAVSNLTYNALRYNRANGHVAVLLERMAAGFRLQVLDDGPGVPEQELGRLLERGLRTDSARARVPEGKGLGLAIARRVAELHGYRIALRNRDEGGLEATLAGPRE